MMDGASTGAVPAATRGGDTRVPDGLRVYAIGDIHGRLDLLDRLHEQIRQDSQTRPRAQGRLVYLGDYIDRGEQIRDLIQRLIEQPLEGFEAVHLKGNHEAFLLDFLDRPDRGEAWLSNGGEATCRSYGVDPWRWDCDDEGLARLAEALTEALPPSHLDFLRGLELMHQAGDYLFVHAGIRPGVPLDAQRSQDLLWIREPFLESDADHGKVVVHGHTPRAAPMHRHNRIGVDTGAVYGGRLTALVLDGDEQSFLQV